MDVMVYPPPRTQLRRGRPAPFENSYTCDVPPRALSKNRPPLPMLVMRWRSVVSADSSSGKSVVVITTFQLASPEVYVPAPSRVISPSSRAEPNKSWYSLAPATAIPPATVFAFWVVYVVEAAAASVWRKMTRSATSRYSYESLLVLATGSELSTSLSTESKVLFVWSQT